MSALEELGLSELEERVYLATLDRDKSTLDELIGACDSTQAAVGHAVEVLQDSGLITRLTGVPPHFLPVRPDVAIGVLLRQREERLGRVRGALAELTERYQATVRGSRPDELLELVHTPDAIHQRWLQLQRSAQFEVRVLDKPPYLDAGNPVEGKLLETGVAFRTVYDAAALEHPGKLTGIWEASAAGEDGRIAPAVPIKLFIVDSRVALAPLRQGDDLAGAVLVHRSTLLDALAALFESVWNRALPLSEFDTHDDAVGRSPLDEQQRHLLQLLASGATDETTARHLGVAHRTVQRQIRALMDAFDVRTRFQLGIRAAHVLGPTARPESR